MGPGQLAGDKLKFKVISPRLGTQEHPFSNQVHEDYSYLESLSYLSVSITIPSTLNMGTWALGMCDSVSFLCNKQSTYYSQRAKARTE